MSEETEAALEKWCRHYAEKFDLSFFKMVTPGRRGFPDRVLLAPNKPPVFIELKRPSGRTSKLQEHVIDTLRKLGYRVEIVRTREEFKILVVEAMIGR